MTLDDQLQKWVAGEPVHNDELGECCPDFSCCFPELLAESAIRQAFIEGSETTRSEFLTAFLDALLMHVGRSDLAIVDKPGAQ